MDKKMIIGAIVVAALVVSLSAGILLMSQEENKGEVKAELIARVNTDGSGMFAREGLDLATDNGPGNVTFHKDAWNMIVIVTPGPSTIQHVMLAEIVADMDYGFLQYTQGTTKTSGNVYWLQMSASGVATDFVQNTIIDAGIIWEPVFSQAIMQETRKAVTVFRTNDTDPNHTCCCIAANSKFLKDNPEVTVAFLAGYIKSVDFVRAAKAEGGPLPTIDPALPVADAVAKLNSNEWSKYTFLVYLGMHKTQKSQEVVVSALSNVEYVSADSDGTLDALETQIKDLTKSFYDMGAVSLKPIENTGCKDVSEFADRFVNGTYIEQAKTFTGTKTATIGVQVISGDIHQIALHIGDALGYFGEYGITLDIDGAPNGPGVISTILSGDKDIGLLGAPPAVINVINMGK